MANFINMALSTGLGPVIAVIIIFIFMGLTYKIAGTIPAVISAFVSTFALSFLDFLPLPWAIGIMFSIVAGLLFERGIGNGN
jgi:uncharacterized membrane protein YkgB